LKRLRQTTTQTKIADLKFVKKFPIDDFEKSRFLPRTFSEKTGEAELERVLNFWWCGGSLADVEPQRLCD
jgi:hypothetical protein